VVSSLQASQHCLQRPWPIEAPNIPRSKSPVHFLCLRSFQSIRPSPRSFVTFRNVFLFFYGGELLAPPPNPQAGRPPLVGCPRLLIQYIRSYPPYLEAFSSNRNLRTRHAVVTRDPLNNQHLSIMQADTKVHMCIKRIGWAVSTDSCLSPETHQSWLRFLVLPLS
jgi:hypothetical protein